MNFWHYYRIINRRKWIGISFVVPVLLIVIFGLYFYPKYPKRKYTASAIILVTSPGYEAVPLYTEQRPWLYSPSHTEIQVSNIARLVTGRTMLIRTAKALKGKVTAAEIYKMVESHPIKGEKLGIELLTDLVEIKVNAPQGRLSRDVANTIAAEFISYYSQLKRQELKLEKKNIKKELNKAKKDFSQAQDAVVAFKQNHNISDLMERNKLLVQRLFNLQTELDENAKKGDISGTEKNSINQTIGSINKELSANLAKTTELAKLEEERNIAKNIYADLSNKLEDKKIEEKSDPSVKSQREYIESRLKQAKDNYKASENAIKDYKKNNNISDITHKDQLLIERLHALQTELDENAKKGDISGTEKNSINRTIDGIKQELSLSLTNQAKLARLEEKKKVAEGTYSGLMKKLVEASIKENSGRQLGFVQVADKAGIPKLPQGYYKFSPKALKWLPAFDYRKLLILAAALALSFGAGIGWIMLLEALDNRIMSADDVKKLFNLPVYGVIPKVNSSLTIKDDFSSYAESYRILYANLAPNSLTDRPNVIMVSSAHPGEGSSTVVENLGYVMAQMGERVCLIDADLRRPSLQKLFGLEGKSGLVQSFLNNTPVNETIIDLYGGNLKVILAGSTFNNPGQLLNSAKMKDLIAAAAEVSDIVLIDTPSIAYYADVSIISRWANQLLFVIKAQEREDEIYHYAISQLQKAELRILGAVLVGAEPEDCQSYQFLSNFKNNSADVSREAYQAPTKSDKQGLYR